jgi:hypothetical protein
MPIFRKRSEPVEARQWNGDTDEFRRWLGYACGAIWADGILIKNRTGRVVARQGDWIVHEDDGFYPVEPVKFHAEYEAAT